MRPASTSSQSNQSARICGFRLLLTITKYREVRFVRLADNLLNTQCANNADSCAVVGITRQVLVGHLKLEFEATATRRRLLLAGVVLGTSSARALCSKRPFFTRH